MLAALTKEFKKIYCRKNVTTQVVYIVNYQLLKAVLFRSRVIAD